MTGLGEELDDDLDLQAGVRLGTGFGLLLAGAVVLGLGVLDLLPPIATRLGLGEVTATRLGVVVAGSLVTAILAAIGSRSPETAGRWPLDAGIAVSMLAVLGAGATAIPSPGSIPGLPRVVWIAYGVGFLSAFAGVLAGTIAPAVSSTGTRGSSVAYERETRRVTPADGGEDEDDLDFLLDDEE